MASLFFLSLNANAFLRESLFGERAIINPYSYCHRAIIAKDSRTLLGNVVSRLKVYPYTEEDDVIDDDLIFMWAEKKNG